MGNFMDDPLYPQRGQNDDSSSKFNVSFGDFTSGIGSIIGSIDSLFGFSQRRQENAQKRLMEQQQQYWNQQNEILYNQQVEQWNRENAYNDPTNAYKRLLDGAEANGLSKAQVLNGAGSQVQSQGASGVKMPGSTSLPSTSGAPVYSMGQGVMNSMRQLAEIDLMESQAQENRSRAGLQGAQTDYTLRSFGLLEANERLILEKALSEPVRRALDSANAALLQAQENRLARLTPYEIDNFVTTSIRNMVSSLESYERGRYISKEIEWYDRQAQSNLDRTQSEIELNAAIAKVQQELVEKYDAETVQQILESEVYRDTIDAIKGRIESESNIIQFNDATKQSDRRWRIGGQIFNGVVSVGSAYLGYRGVKLQGKALNHKIEQDALNRVDGYKTEIMGKISSDGEFVPLKYKETHSNK